VAMLPFGNVTCVLSVPGRIVLEALNHGVSNLPSAAGYFPQVSGLTMTVDASAPAGNRVREVRVGGQPLDPAKLYTLAIPDFMLRGGDGYTMFAGQKVIVAPEAGALMVTGLEKYVAAKGEVSPRVDGRIAIK
jgi:5'-nucleotidase/UDP-sugar diphosphatase